MIEKNIYTYIRKFRSNSSSYEFKEEGGGYGLIRRGLEVKITHRSQPDCEKSDFPSL